MTHPKTTTPKLHNSAHIGSQTLITQALQLLMPKAFSYHARLLLVAYWPLLTAFWRWIFS